MADASVGAEEDRIVAVARQAAAVPHKDQGVGVVCTGTSLSLEAILGVGSRTETGRLLLLWCVVLFMIQQ